MLWGVSKSVGGGFRVGVGGRLGGRRSSGTRAPTAAEVRAQEKDHFLRETLTRFQDAVAVYFLNRGHLVMAQDIAKADQELAAPLIPSMQEFTNIQRLVSDGGNLTESRKEKLLSAIYAIEEMGEVDNEHPIRGLYNKYAEQQSAQGAYIILGIISVITGYFWLPAFFATAFFFAGYIYSVSQVTDIKLKIKEQALSVVTTLPN